jgi:hypothetical protein
VTESQDRLVLDCVEEVKRLVMERWRNAPAVQSHPDSLIEFQEIIFYATSRFRVILHVWRTDRMEPNCPHQKWADGLFRELVSMATATVKCNDS